MSTAPIREQILTTMSLYEVVTRADLVEIVRSHPGCEWDDLVHTVLDMLIDEGSVTQETLSLGVAIIRHVEREPVVPLAEQMAVADKYRKAHSWSRNPLRWLGVKS